MKKIMISLLAAAALASAAMSASAATVSKTYHATLTLLSTTTVDVNAWTGYLSVTNRGGTLVWVTNDGSTPAANADGSYAVGPGETRVFPVTYGSASVKIYATVATAVSVEPWPIQ